jgi:hypothetical protein
MPDKIQNRDLKKRAIFSVYHQSFRLKLKWLRWYIADRKRKQAEMAPSSDPCVGIRDLGFTGQKYKSPHLDAAWQTVPSAVR